VVPSPMDMRANWDCPYHILSPEPDIIAGVMAHWMDRPFVGLDETDWFCFSE